MILKVLKFLKDINGVCFEDLEVLKYFKHLETDFTDNPHLYP